MDNPDNMCSVVLSDGQLLQYLDKIRKRTLDYLDTITDDMLYEKPQNCPYTRLQLVLRQFKHLSFHTGIMGKQRNVQESFLYRFLKIVFFLLMVLYLADM